MQAPASWTELDEINILGRRLFLVPRKTESFFPLPILDSTHSPEPTERVAGILREAAALIRECGAEYAAWVDDAIPAIVPVRPPGELGYSSGSLTGIYGIMYQSFPVTPLVAAEGLIHEASHQYYYLAQLETLFSNGQDTRLYWSPYPRMNRPIDRILLAFHAFANVTLFYRAYVAAGISTHSERAKREIVSHLDNLLPLSEALERSTGLTADGRALFDALSEKLFE